MEAMDNGRKIGPKETLLTWDKKTETQKGTTCTIEERLTYCKMLLAERVRNRKEEKENEMRTKPEKEPKEKAKGRKDDSMEHDPHVERMGAKPNF